MSAPARPLANRVDPFGQLFATPARGAWFGNRGGRFHDPASRQVRGRPYATRQWICCVLSFKGRRRTVWGEGYTELFFSDESAALAAGHRPCFECRRADALAFAAAWGRAAGTPPPRAPTMDAVLHSERLNRSDPRSAPLEELPDGAMISLGGAAHLVAQGELRPWSFAGYGSPVTMLPAMDAPVLTPPSILAVLRAGYVPVELRGPR